MKDDDQVLDLLASIDRRLALLTAPQELAMRSALETGLLRTHGRIAMFAGIDGQRDTQDIAKLAEVSDRAVQLFVQELLTLGLVRDTGRRSGRATIVERDDEAILRWYLDQGNKE